MSGAGTKGTFVPPRPSIEEDPQTYLARVFVYFLQNLFRTAPDGFGMRWLPEEKDSEIIITGEKPRLEEIALKPHIVCVLGSAQWSGLALDQLQALRIATGQRTHTDLIPMTVSYHCQAKEGLMASRLAWQSAFWTNVFRRLLQRQGRLHHVSSQISVSAESPASAFVGPAAEDDIVSCVTTVPFYWQPSWTITDPTPVLRQIDVNLGARIELRPPMFNGKPLQAVTKVPEPKVVEKFVVLED